MNAKFVLIDYLWVSINMIVNQDIQPFGTTLLTQLTIERTWWTGTKLISLQMRCLSGDTDKPFQTQELSAITAILILDMCFETVLYHFTNDFRWMKDASLLLKSPGLISHLIGTKRIENEYWEIWRRMLTMLRVSTKSYLKTRNGWGWMEWQREWRCQEYTQYQMQFTSQTWKKEIMIKVLLTSSKIPKVKMKNQRQILQKKNQLLNSQKKKQRIVNY